MRNMVVSNRGRTARCLLCEVAVRVRLVGRGERKEERVRAVCGEEERSVLTGFPQSS